MTETQCARGDQTIISLLVIYPKLFISSSNKNNTHSVLWLNEAAHCDITELRTSFFYSVMEACDLQLAGLYHVCACCCHLLFRWCFRAEIRWCSLGAISGLYNRYSKISHWKCSRNYWMILAVCSWGSSRGSKIPFVSSPGHLHLIAAPASHSMCLQWLFYSTAQSLITVHHYGPKIFLAITFPPDITTLNFSSCWNPGYFHSMPTHFVCSGPPYQSHMDWPRIEHKSLQ